MAWTNAPSPGQHCMLGLSAADTSNPKPPTLQERQITSPSLMSLNVTQAIIAELNIAVPKQFRCSINTVGGIMDANLCCNNQDLQAILLALCTLYGNPSPAEKQANMTAFAAQWNPADPIEAYLDHLEDYYMTVLIATPPYT